MDYETNVHLFGIVMKSLFMKWIVSIKITKKQ